MAEYFNRAAALAQSAAELSKRVSEGLVENAKDFGFENPVQFYDTAELKLSDVREKLASRADRDKLEGMKRLVAVIAKGHDASPYFPDVVKNVAVGNLEIRQLVYIYLLRYAEQEQDLALLAINTFQKDLSDTHAGIRVMALRVLSSIRVPLISSIVMMAIQKGVTDRSSSVRKTAAYAIPKLYSLDPETAPGLVAVVRVLLNDNSPITIGSAIQAFNEVCPDRFDLIHPHFAKLCDMLIDADEWGQIAIVNLLLRYARTQFTNPNPVPLKPEVDGSTVRVSSSRSADGYESISDDDGQRTTDSTSLTSPPALDPDHVLLLQAFWPLLQSDNCAVVMAVVAALYHLGPVGDLPRVVKPLIRVLRAGHELEYAVLTQVAVICDRRPDLFHAHLRHFFVVPTDPAYVWQLKLRILRAAISPPHAPTLLRELQRYLQTGSTDLVRATVLTIAHCAVTLPREAGHRDPCLRGLIILTRHRDVDIAGYAVESLRTVILAGCAADCLRAILVDLLSLLTGPTTPTARAAIYDLVGRHAADLHDHVLDALRLGGRTFREEPAEVKLQIITMAARALATLCLDPAKPMPEEQEEVDSEEGQHSPPIAPLARYLFTLARYDLEFDVRDRARFLQALVQPILDREAGTPPPDEPHLVALQTALAQAFLEDDAQPSAIVKAPTGPASSQGTTSQFTLGSLALVLGRPVPGYHNLPTWPTTRPSPVDRGTGQPASMSAVPSARSALYDAHPRIIAPASATESSTSSGGRRTAATARAAAPGKHFKTLDDFYSDDDTAEILAAAKANPASSGAFSSHKGRSQYQESESDESSSSSPVHAKEVTVGRDGAEYSYSDSYDSYSADSSTTGSSFYSSDEGRSDYDSEDPSDSDDGPTPEKRTLVSQA
ncbi:AP-3 complex subunit beta [Tieghemiomyces parasiticus]|uniref:AP-3 complex subunit beta n=1 Tax=Tieghemiomyces parasiticus TaxID=78921 RepID=A0A9W8DZY0_9FUNG|nr:AP-3 complex subunit beta [Tieghemiomyces parasiticus]